VSYVRAQIASSDLASSDFTRLKSCLKFRKAATVLDASSSRFAEDAMDKN
jgi:hypothetical protein